MGGRFSRIKQGAKLEAARLALRAYEDSAGTRPSRVGQGKARDLDAICYIMPFTINVLATEVVAAKAYNNGYTTLAALINASTVAEVTNSIGAKTLVNIPKFRPARVTWFRNATRSVTTPPSKFTNQQYLKYTGTTFSCPFGATADTDDLISSFLDVKTRVLAQTGFQVSRVSLVREQVGIESV